MHLADDRVAVGADRVDPELALAIALDQLDKAGQALRFVPPDRVKLRRGIQTRLVRLQDPQQPVALEVALGADRGVVSDDPRLERRIADRHRPRERERRRLDRRGHRVVAMDHVVKQRPRPADRMLPEDRVTDEPVGTSRCQQRLKLRARPLRVEMTPGDRRETRVPVPLPAVAPRTRARVGKRHAIALANNPAPLKDAFAALTKHRHTCSLTNESTRSHGAAPDLQPARGHRAALWPSHKPRHERLHAVGKTDPESRCHERCLEVVDCRNHAAAPKRRLPRLGTLGDGQVTGAARSVVRQSSEIALGFAVPPHS